ncbi:MAG TPA: tRNA pseudouridine(55) synthase TruB [Candidatus Polarisedimenticolaceae bacterium]|nr:tRNA pseudouridine(55) synthase TruB [Candidatus Polarisedimenticolaceae bacterium]
MTLEGALCLDKPAGPTSHDLVARARRLLGQPRIGHAGTLDPPATGLLVLLLGRATRLLRFLDDEPKRYTGSFRLGITTSTDDAAGTLVSQHAGPLPSAEAVLGAAEAAVGTALQVPPSFSARKVEGVRAYRLARRGIAVRPPATEVTVSSLSLFPGATDADWGFDATVSGGTYVRALVRDLGVALGCGASVTALRRKSAGAFRLPAAALTGDERADARAWQEAVVPLRILPLALPTLALGDPLLARRFRAGTPLPWMEPGEGEVAVHDASGELLGVGLFASAALRPRVILADPQALW